MNQKLFSPIILFKKFSWLRPSFEPWHGHQAKLPAIVHSLPKNVSEMDQ